jgi:probable rRNA maturation factor
MRLRVHNAQRLHRVDTAALRRFARWLATQALGADGSGFGEIAIVLTDDAGIAATNEAFLGHEGPTDVITFAFEPAPGQPGRAGEIHVNVQRAAEEARHRRIAAGRELAFYVAHGFDHLGGANDRTTAQRALMHSRERAWLRQAAAAGHVQDGWIEGKRPVALARRAPSR